MCSNAKRIQRSSCGFPVKGGGGSGFTGSRNEKTRRSGYALGVERHYWAVILAPLAALGLAALALAIKLAIARYMPDCWLKRALLKERVRSAYSESNRRVIEEAARRSLGKR
jgi:hypothetical protein